MHCTSQFRIPDSLGSRDWGGGSGDCNLVVCWVEEGGITEAGCILRELREVLGRIQSVMQVQPHFTFLLPHIHISRLHRIFLTRCLPVRLPFHMLARYRSRDVCFLWTYVTERGDP
ncbi:hypothetical protein E2C01_089192 [Portunus trituberculatus]|uniref:Uncharacterized protein n=1 Tax=Portunus trituberculatus TaxID=210409 RepID=A0A5B7J849_PORTR|nr:hypothetical protein [Portunus trituberculatus]